METALWVLVAVVGYLGYACWLELKNTRAEVFRLGDLVAELEKRNRPPMPEHLAELHEIRMSRKK